MTTSDDVIWKGLDYKDRKVSLNVDQRDHIIERHAAMSYNFHAIYDTVRSPDTVYTSRDYSNREVYFGKCKGATYESRGFETKVIVEYGENTGHIVTAFPVKEEGGNIDRKIYPDDGV